jgi:arylsulfatase
VVSVVDANVSRTRKKRSARTKGEVKAMRSHLVPIYACGLTLLAATSADAQPKRGEIIHDAEHYVLLEEHRDHWAEEDVRNRKRLEEIRAQNAGKRPNFIYILIDDVGYGEFGIPELNYVRG